MTELVEPFFDFRNVEFKTDNILIDTKIPKEKGISFKITNPKYEGKSTTYFSIIRRKEGNKDEKIKYYMYYRSVLPQLSIYLTNYDMEYTCLMTSDDGINFTKPELEFSKELKNIILHVNGVSHNFSILNKDKSDLVGEKYLAIGGVFSNQRCNPKYGKLDGLKLLMSDDGIEWNGKTILNKANSIKQNYGTCYDSINNLIYDDVRDLYVIYARYNKCMGTRQVQRATSKDLNTWSNFSLVNIDFRNNQIYCSGISKYPNSPYYIGLPNYQVAKNKQTNKVFLMFSDDGINFNKIKDNYIKSEEPHRAVSNFVLSKDESEYLIYVDFFLKNIVKCYSVRRDGFCSICCNDDKEGIIIMKEMYLTNNNIKVNFKTYKNGYIQFLLVDINNKGKEKNKEIIVCESEKMIGDFLKQEIKWKTKTKINSDKDLVLDLNKKVKIKLKNCELFSFYYQTNKP